MTLKRNKVLSRTTLAIRPFCNSRRCVAAWIGIVVLATFRTYVYRLRDENFADSTIVEMRLFCSGWLGAVSYRSESNGHCAFISVVKANSEARVAKDAN